MSKKDWIWVAIRIFGIYLLVMAVVALPGLVKSGWVSYHYREFMKAARAAADETEHSGFTDLSLKLLEANLAQVIGGAARVIVFTIVGIYLLASGRLLFRLIYRKELAEEPGGPA